jgi:acyl-CoA synthetase (AMP-forming)/AMP-acid ligase II
MASLDRRSTEFGRYLRSVVVMLATGASIAMTRSATAVVAAFGVMKCEVIGVSIELRFLFESAMISALAIEEERPVRFKRATAYDARCETVVRASAVDQRVAHLSDEHIDAMREAVARV